MMISISHSKQNGAVLVVSLVLLLLITLVAITTLSSSTFQTSMVNNVQKRESVFRVAESAAEQSLTQAALSQAYTQTSYTVPTANLSTSETEVSMSARVVSLGNGAPPMGFSISGGSPFVNRVYEAQGTAASSDTKVATQVIQGAAKTEPNVGCAVYDC